MSSSDLSTQERVVLTKDRVKEILSFFKIEKITPSDALTKALNAFEENETYENQCNIRAELARTILMGRKSEEDNIWKEEVFNLPELIGGKDLFEKQFDEDLEAFLCDGDDEGKSDA